MYGENTINDHMLIRYCFAEDLFSSFSALTHKGIELPLLMLEPYYRYITKTVDKLMQRNAFVRKTRKKRNAHEMKDFFASLQRLPPRAEDAGDVAQRSTILLRGLWIEAALQVFRDNDVLLIIANSHDRRAVEGQKLPENFQLFDFQAQFAKEAGQFSFSGELYSQIKELVRLHRTHPIFGRHDFLPWLCAQVRDAICLVEVADKVMRDYPIGITLDHSELVYPGNVFSLVSRTFGLPFVYVQHYLISDVNVIPSRATHYAVWGAYTKAWLAEKGVEPGTIFTIGSLRLASALQYSLKSREEAFAPFNLPPQNPVIVLATSPYTEKTNTELMNWFAHALSDLPVALVIKPHPDDFYSYQEWTCDNIRLLPGTVSLQDLLSACDMVATVASTVAIEAAFHQKPILVLLPSIPYHFNLHHNEYPQHLAKAEAGFIVQSADELRQVIADLIQSKEKLEKAVELGQHFLRHTLDLDGPSPMEKLAHLVCEILHSK